MEQGTPPSLSCFNISMDGVRVSVQEIDKVLHATAHDVSTGEYLDTISLSFPPPATASFVSSPESIAFGHLSYPLRKRKRSVGTAVADPDLLLNTAPPSSYVPELTPISSVTSSCHQPAPDMPVSFLVSDMDIDLAPHLAPAVAKPVKKRAKSIDTTNTHLSLTTAAPGSCPPSASPPSASQHTTTFIPLPTTDLANSTTTPPFPPSPIHSPSHADVPGTLLQFCDTPPGSRSASPLHAHVLIPNVSFRAAPMTPADEPAHSSSFTPYTSSNLSFSSMASNLPGQVSSIHALSRINNLPKWVAQLDGMPEPMIHYALFQILRRCSVSTLQFVHGIVSPALKRDFLCLLPYEIAANILQRLDHVSLCRSARVSHRWRSLVDSDMHLWRTLGARDGFWPLDNGTLPNGSMLRIRNLYDIARIQSARQVPISRIAPDLMPFLDPSSVARVLAGEHHIDPRDVVPPQIDHPFKSMYTRGRQLQNAWMNKDPKMISFVGHGSAVVTCLQFDEDKVVSGSDDQTICVYDIRTGALRMRLEGHEGGVWALQYVGNTLVSGSTDRTVRVWDLRTGRTTHIFHGHTSTVRCLQLLLPIPEPGMPPPSNTVHVGTPYRGGYLSSSTYLGHTPTPKLQEPLIVTGSRDTHLRVWRLPEPSDAPWPPAEKPTGRTVPGLIRRCNAFSSNTPNVSMPDLFGIVVDGQNDDNEAGGSNLMNEEDDVDMDQELSSSFSTTPTGAGGPTIGYGAASSSMNPYFRHVLTGHGASVRALAGHGHIVCSGSYDCTVRVWDVVTGTCMWQLSGHTNKVYSIVYDGLGRCWSGAMDSQVRCWDVHTGICLAVLDGHSSLVGLLEISPNYLISAAADSTLRVWNTADNSLVHSLQAHTNAITCFHYDAHKIVSGSEGAIKLWDPKSGKVVRDLVTGVTSVWRLQVNERYCVAAVNRDARTEFLVLDFDSTLV